jgi:HD-like signal output (HDOD) protein
VNLRILFVDDEPSVLRSLARTIRIRRLPWDAAFVDGGPAALAELETRPFDAVVTDLAMPEMDGVVLLSQVAARWPAVSRLMLTGEFAVAQSLRATRVAHQFLAKPCDGVRLEQTVERLERIGRLQLSPEVRAAAARAASLPSAPRTHAEIREAVARNADFATLARLVETDIALSAKLLQLVSTPFFTLARDVSTARGALAILGVDVVQSVLFSPQTFRTSEMALSLPFQELHDRSLEAARRAREKAPRELADRAQLAGWLHDVGRLVLACVHGCARTFATGGEPAQCAAAGAYLLGLWGLPDDVVDAVAYQHAPDAAPEQHRPLAALIHAVTRAPAEKPQPASATAQAASCAW